jgi:hypothetical protein
LAEHQTDHPLGCHRRRIPERVVFEKLVQVLLFGCAYERIADASCSESTLPRRREEWIELGVMEHLRQRSAWKPTIASSAWSFRIWRWTGASPRHRRRRAEGGKEPRGQGQKGRQALDGGGRQGHTLGRHHRPRQSSHDSALLVPTLKAATESLGALAEGASVHLETEATTRV